MMEGFEMKWRDEIVIINKKRISEKRKNERWKISY